MALGSGQSLSPLCVWCVIKEVSQGQLVIAQRCDGGVDQWYEVDGEEATHIVDSLAF